MTAAPPRHGVDVDLDELIGLRLRARRLPLQALHRRHRGISPGRSRLRGRGMEYLESRAYLPGDDVRHIDWKVMARSAEPYTKVFQEERERPVFLVVDLSPGAFFGTVECLKSVLAARAAALIAWSAEARGDRVGALVAGPGVEPGAHRELAPASGRRGVLRVLQALAQLGRCPASLPLQAGGGLGPALERARRVVRPGSLVVVVSDFAQLAGAPAGGEVRDAGAAAQRVVGHLHRLREHDDLLLVAVADVLEHRLPPPGRYPIAGPGAAGGLEMTLLELGDPGVRAAWQAFNAARRERLANLARALAATLVELVTGVDPLAVLAGSVPRHAA
jgi:uncharacterized protein (DUF58 family)